MLLFHFLLFLPSKSQQSSEKRDVFKNNLLVISVHGRKVENQPWVEKVNVQEFLYTALKMFAVPASEITVGKKEKRAERLRGNPEKKGFISFGKFLVWESDRRACGMKTEGLWMFVLWFMVSLFSREIKLKELRRRRDLAEVDASVEPFQQVLVFFKNRIRPSKEGEKSSDVTQWEESP